MRIALIHAVTQAMSPIHDAFDRHWPDAERINILDDSLGRDRADDAMATSCTDHRIKSLGRYALDCNVDAVLYTCSAFGRAIDTVAADAQVPVRKPNEAMFREVLNYGDHIGLLGTFGPAMQGMREEFEALCRQQGAGRLDSLCIEHAGQALREGRQHEHEQLICDAIQRLAHCDAIMLAHFSTSLALDPARQRTSRPVLSSPDAAVRALKHELCPERQP
ncbi:hypothetical protein ACSEE7_02480 [Halomonas cupida]|uniref:hypothetical protein n=1 Tax=Halomonas cupida TaxID=44933 RepID=UPI003EF4EF92